MQTGWYYSVDGRNEGPLDDAHFADAYLAGTITDTTQVWWDGATSGWVALAQSQRFAELDRWYVRNGAQVIGPLTGGAVRAQIADLRSQGRSVDTLEVRLERSQWVALANAVPLREPVAPAPVVVPPRAVELPEPTSTFDEETYAKVKRRRMAGIVMLMIGGSLIVAGGGVAGGYASGTLGPKGLHAGIAMAVLGVPPLIAGSVLYGVSNKRLQKLQLERAMSLRVAPLGGRNTAGIVLGGRF